MPMEVSKDWLLEERLQVIGAISARWENHVDSAERQDLIEAIKIIRMVSRLRSDVLELNRQIIISFV